VSYSPRYELKLEMTSEQARTLLDRLADDPDFRAALESSPADALAEYGISAEGLDGPVAVPSVEEVDNFRRLGDLLPGGEEYVPFMPCLVWGALAYASAAAASGEQAV